MNNLKIINYVKFCVIMTMFILLLYGVIKYVNKVETSQFNLSELNDGIFAYKETVVSRTPAHNYSMVTVCDDSGNVFTVKGSVYIVYTDTDSPYAILQERNIVNGDDITLYVPQGTVKYLGTTDVK